MFIDNESHSNATQPPLTSINSEIFIPNESEIDQEIEHEQN